MKNEKLKIKRAVCSEAALFLWCARGSMDNLQAVLRLRIGAYASKCSSNEMLTGLISGTILDFYAIPHPWHEG